MRVRTQQEKYKARATLVLELCSTQEMYIYFLSLLVVGAYYSLERTPVREGLARNFRVFPMPVKSPSRSASTRATIRYFPSLNTTARRYYDAAATPITAPMTPRRALIFTIASLEHPRAPVHRATVERHPPVNMLRSSKGGIGEKGPVVRGGR